MPNLPISDSQIPRNWGPPGPKSLRIRGFLDPSPAEFEEFGPTKTQAFLPVFADLVCRICRFRIPKSLGIGVPRVLKSSDPGFLDPSSAEFEEFGPKFKPF